jgi:hypothetical protein
VAFHLLFSYSDEDSPSLFEATAIKNGTLFIFDEQDSLIAQLPITNPVLNQKYHVELELDSGMYQFVTWFYQNSAPYYFTIPQPEIVRMKEAARLNVLIPQESSRTFTNFDSSSRLVYGQTQINDLEQLTGKKPIEIPLELDYNSIHIRINGLEKTDDEYEISITDNNGIYSFDNTILPMDDFHYTSTTRFQDNSDVLTASLNVLKLQHGHTRPILLIKNITQDRLIYTGSLISILQEAYHNNGVIDFQHTHIFYLELLMNGETISVLINDWNDPKNWNGNTTLSN